MTSPVGLLDFFTIEATDYIDRLDALVASPPATGADPDALLRHARMLRGSSTMARQSGIAEVAGGIERVARALREGAIRWNPQLGAVLIAAVDDLKLLLRSVRNWSTADERRAQARAVELARLAPEMPRRAPTPSSVSGGAFLVAETSEIAEALEQVVRRHGDRGALEVALAHVRTLRGVAAIRDMPPLPEVADAIERAAKPLELGAGTASQRQMALFTAAAMLLRRVSTEIASGRRPESTAPEVRQFAAAAAALSEDTGDADRIIPISELYFADAGPHVVSAAPNPPTSPTERFRMEVVSQAEHLRRLVADAMRAQDQATRERVARELRNGLRALGSAALSFSEDRIARFVAALAPAAASLETRALTALDRVATLLANPSVRGDELSRQLQQLEAGGKPSTATPTSSPRTKVMTPTGQELKDFLDRGLAGFGLLQEAPLTQPAPLPDEAVVPIEQLLYRGRAALERAMAIREEVRGRGNAVSQESIDELFDLIELALVE